MTGWTAIFRAGTHTDSSGNTRTFSNADLDNIIASYSPKKHEAPLVIGHPETNSPAFGWVKKMKRKGETLLAKFAQVSDELKQAVAAGHYKKVSIALYKDGSLRHVGLLGGMPPAVKGLGDVQFGADDEVRTYEFAEPPGGAAADPEKNMEVEELKKKLAALEAKFSEGEKAREALEKKTDAAEARAQAAEDAKAKLEAAYAEREKAERQKGREAKFSELLKAGKVTPAEKEMHLGMASALSDVGEIEFAEGDAKVKKSAEDAYWKMLDERPAHGLLDEYSEPAPAGGATPAKDPAKTF